MSLIRCPECGNSISDKAEKCPHCGLPASYFSTSSQDLSGRETGILDYQNLSNVLLSFQRDHAAFFSPEHYISHRDAQRLRGTYEKYSTSLSNKLIFQYICNNASSLRVDIDALWRFMRQMETLDADVAAHNNAYVDRGLQRDKEYFDSILKQIDPRIQLDEEQRRAVITDDDYCLLVAGAGAGKTTTMAAKVKYLVDKKRIDPSEIIVISYTNQAIGELKERINKGLGIPAKICTFHAFAYDIVKQFSAEPPEINFSSQKIIFDMLEKAIFHNKQLMRNLVLFLGYYFDLTEDVFQFTNLNQYHLYRAAQDFETLKSGLGEYIKKVERQRTKSTRTITGEYLRSMQEVQIANFLYLNGLDYEYERVYPFGSPSRNKKYTPDFYILQGEHSAWLEHYALSESGYNSLFDTRQRSRYLRAISDKRRLHKANRTTLLETWSFYLDRRPLLEHLKEVLEGEGFILKPRNLEEVYKKIVETGKDKYIYKLILFMREFIEQYKTTGYDEGGFSILREKTDNPRTLLFLEIAEQVYHHYQSVLKQRNQIDFADMINDAHFYLQEIERQNIPLPYRYIIIDEFQDIARQRFNLTKRMSQITQAKVVAVGDDWQSIYAFSGSDITLFTRFLELMGAGTELKITHTYRNSQELIDIAGGFVQKNSTQIRKQLISPKHLENPIVIEVFDDSFKPMVQLSNAVEGIIGEILSEYGEKSSIDTFPINIICSDCAGHPGLFRRPFSVAINQSIQRIHQPIHKRVEGGIKHIGQLFADTGAPGAGFQCAVLLRKVLAQGHITWAGAGWRRFPGGRRWCRRCFPPASCWPRKPGPYCSSTW